MCAHPAGAQRDPGQVLGPAPTVPDLAPHGAGASLESITSPQPPLGSNLGSEAAAGGALGVPLLPPRCWQPHAMGPPGPEPLG